MRQAFTRLLFVCATVLLLALAAVPVAYAHAALLATMPADDAVVGVAPRAAELRFNEPVSPLAIKLLGPHGSGRDLLDATQGGETVTVTLPQAMPQGTYLLSWRVVSTDGHPIGGSLVFSVGAVSEVAPELAPTDRAVAAILWASKAVLFTALLGGIGGIVFGAVTPLPAVCQRLCTILVVLGLVAVPVSLAMQGLDALDLPLASIGDGKVWTAALSTSYGVTAATAMVAFALSLAALATGRSRISGLLALLALATGALAIAMSGHASAASP
ncbi:MAG: Copper resistance protein, partial [Devosia sp.]|uniref:copper resistance CopC family protein n=1 Tax=Devosia sp. TaxID=1871048 RepID=UPI00261AB320